MYVVLGHIVKCCFWLLQTIFYFFISGQEQHVGTKAPPREIVLENSVMPKEPGLVRVQVVYTFCFVLD